MRPPALLLSAGRVRCVEAGRGEDVGRVEKALDGRARNCGGVGGEQDRLSKLSAPGPEITLRPLVGVEHEVVAKQVSSKLGDGDRLEPGERLDTFVDRVTSRESCSSQGVPHTDKIVSIDFSGPNSALAKVELSIPGTDFIDFLS